MSSGIYCIKNKINKKRYFGQAIDIKYRIKAHKQSLRRNDERESIRLRRSWDKYGENNFEYFPYLFLPKINFILNLFEIFFIWIFRTTNPKYGYNISHGGNVIMRGRKHSEYTKNKMSDMRKGVPKSEETKKRMSEAQKGRKFSKKHLEKLSISRSRENLSKSTLLKMKNNNTGKGNPQFGKKSSSSTSKYYNVYLDKSRNKWCISIKVNGKKIQKRFDTELEAAIERDKIVIENHLDCSLNFPA